MKLKYKSYVIKKETIEEIFVSMLTFGVDKGIAERVIKLLEDEIKSQEK